MEASTVYYTDFRCPVGTSLTEKLRRLCIAAGIKSIDMDGKFVAIKMHFGELGNLAFLRPNYATEHFPWLIEKYGLRKVRFHDLRHTFATHALTSGVDAKTLAGILGHTNASFTLDTYTHVTPDMREAAGGIVGGFMEDLFGKELKPWQRNEKQATD